MTGVPGLRHHRRRIGLAGVLLLTVLVGLRIETAPDEFEARSTLLLQPSAAGDNTYVSFPASLIAFGDVIARQVSADKIQAELLADRPGSSSVVALTDTGNQWDPIYDRPTLTVLVRSPSAPDAAALLKDTIVAVHRLLVEDQRAAGVPAGSLVTASPIDGNGPVVAGGRLSRAFAGLLLLGIAGCFAVIRLTPKIAAGPTHGRAAAHRPRQALPSTPDIMSRSR